MKKLITCFILFLALIETNAQNRYNVACKNFTYQKEQSEIGNNLREIFEISLSNPNFPFKILEREKMDLLFQSIQEEKNLFKDFSNEFDKKLQLAGIDYFVIGNIDLDVATGQYTLLVNFIKITGSDLTEKLPLMISINKNELSDNKQLKKLFDSEIEKFANTYFILKSEKSSLEEVPDFIIELKKRDSIINYLENDANIKTNTINNLSYSIGELQKDNLLKNKQIEKLNDDVIGIKEYSNVARLSILGTEVNFGEGLTFSSELYNLMSHIYLRKDGKLIFKLTDTTLNILNEVITKYSRFPFGYSTKANILLFQGNSDWQGFALKAIEILNITTTIEGHNSNHDEVLTQLKNNLFIYQNSKKGKPASSN